MKTKAPTALLLAAATATPAPPPLTHLFMASVTPGATITIGPEAGGTRVALPIAGGTFLPTGVDAGLVTSENYFYPDGLAVLQTADGANILFRDQGFQTTNASIYGAVTFQTGAARYAWLNTVVAVSSAAFSDGGIALDVFILGDGIPSS
ncbi:hypothetical protein F5B18DRAFT_651828 [Nemania serpens]|nr:hypothetical protein F5B18DRAFT_651828 [Nemania serpens]